MWSVAPCIHHRPSVGGAGGVETHRTIGPQCANPQTHCLHLHPAQTDRNGGYLFVTAASIRSRQNACATTIFVLGRKYIALQWGANSVRV